MTAVAAVAAARPDAAADGARVRRMLSAAAAGRGEVARAVAAALPMFREVGQTGAPDASGAHLAAAPHDGLVPGAVLARVGPVLVAADAALVRRGALRAALAQAAGATGTGAPELDEAITRARAAGSGAPAAAESADALLVAAAWLAWGERMVDRLDGDFAVVIWDARRGTLCAARDPVGRRPLHWAATPALALVASTAGGVVAGLPAPPPLHPLALAAQAAGLLEHPDETVYRGVRVLPAGHRLAWRPGEEGRVERWWHPPTFERGPALPFETAAAELRERLVEAAAERLPTGAPAAVWVSGGWDSPAVYGAAQRAAAERGGGPVVPVSMSYPPGDRGREDETVSALAAHHGATVCWGSVADAPLVAADPLAAAAARDEPFAHAYEGWTALLARVTRAAGAPVALDGAGGDQLFAVTPVFVAELVRHGRLLAAHAALRDHLPRGGARGGARRAARAAALDWWRWAVRPLLPGAALRLLGRLRGGPPLRGHLERPVPPWIRAPGGDADALLARARSFRTRRGESVGAAETRWYLTTPYAGRILAAQSAAALGAGVELRSPLLDRRVVELAAPRPVEERAGGGETKRLLRAASRGLVPEAQLAPRVSRTGLSSDYFRRELRRHLPELAALAAGGAHLASYGVVEPGALQRTVDAALQGRLDEDLALALLLTLQAELWLRGR